MKTAKTNSPKWICVETWRGEVQVPAWAVQEVEHEGEYGLSMKAERWFSRNDMNGSALVALRRLNARASEIEARMASEAVR